MLLGEIPDRALFRVKYLKKSLAPYYQLTQGSPALPIVLPISWKTVAAVRVGDVARFTAVVKEFTAQFQADHTYTLILRYRLLFLFYRRDFHGLLHSLRHNVIKTGIRIICLSYQRISLSDVAAKLQLDSAEDAQYIVAKVPR